MRSPLDSWMTPDEQKLLLGFLCMVLAGMLCYYTGINALYARKAEGEKARVQQAVVDSTVQIDIRTATAEELELLPGVGEKRAQAIIASRQENPFTSQYDILRIKGIGEKTYAKMVPMLLRFGSQDSSQVQTIKKSGATAASSTKKDEQGEVHLNSAGLEELMSLNGIGEKKAQAILDYRSEKGKFGSIDQITEVKGIGEKTLEKNRDRLRL